MSSSAAEGRATGEALRSARRLIAPLALAQFICSFAGSNMNVMITDISDDLNTDVKGVQTAITLFLLIDGDPDDPLQQADRPVGPEALPDRGVDAVRRSAPC